MESFVFYNPTEVLFGQQQIARLAERMPADARILITYGGGSVIRFGTLDEVRQALHKHTFFEFGGIEPNPSYETLMQAVAAVKEHQIDYLLAVGGGSVVDGTKFIAAAACFTGDDPWDILSKQAPVERALPLSCILTLPATGSETNSFAVISRKSDHSKLAFASPCVYPQHAVLDPTKTYTLPERQISNGVVDAFIHILEQYLTYPVNAKVQDRFAEGLLLTLLEEGPRALATPTDYDIRANIMWSATMALNGLIGVGVPQDWSTHAIGHELTAAYGLDHAQTLAIVLPVLLDVQREQKKQKLLQYAERIWGLRDGKDEHRINKAIEKTREFFEMMRVKTHLADYGINAKDAAEKVVASLKRHHMTALGEHKDITPEVVARILLMA